MLFFGQLDTNVELITMLINIINHCHKLCSPSPLKQQSLEIISMRVNIIRSHLSHEINCLRSIQSKFVSQPSLPAPTHPTPIIQLIRKDILSLLRISPSAIF